MIRLGLSLLSGILTSPFALGAETSTPPLVPVISIQDSINPGTGAHIMESIERAEANHAAALVMELDTPGGLLSTTRQIVQKMLGTNVPIVVFVSPKGAHAGSAGALITFASDIAVMAPGTQIGAAHPVNAGGDSPSEDAPSKTGAKPTEHKSVMEQKITKDTAAFARSLAHSKGRNIAWAEKAVLDSDSIIAEEALKQDVIDLIADNTEELVSKLKGLKLRKAKSGIDRLPLDLGPAERWPMAVKNRVVSFFSDPNLAYMMLSFGGLCLWIELTHPGFVLPGVVGVFCILVSLISFQLLPISYGALALILIGIAMLIAEAFLPTFGVLGVGGIVCFIVGSLFVMDTVNPLFQISLKLILPTAAALVTIAGILGTLLWRARARQSKVNLGSLIGETGQVKENISAKPGTVFVRGELWSAVAEPSQDIAQGKLVRVVDCKNMQLIVTPHT